MKPIGFANWYLSKLGSYPPTETRRQGAYLPSGVGWNKIVNSFGIVVISQAGTLRGGLGHPGDVALTY